MIRNPTSTRLPLPLPCFAQAARSSTMGCKVCCRNFSAPGRTARCCCARLFGFQGWLPLPLGKKLVLICDEFQEIRTLENFPNSQNVVAVLRSEVQSQSEVQYILAGSAISVLAGLLSHPDSPLFAQFTRISIEAFDRESTRELVNKLLSDPLEEDLYPILHSLTAGHPFYITALSRRGALSTGYGSTTSFYRGDQASIFN